MKIIITCKLDRVDKLRQHPIGHRIALVRPVDRAGGRAARVHLKRSYQVRPMDGLQPFAARKASLAGMFNRASARSTRSGV